MRARSLFERKETGKMIAIEFSIILVAFLGVAFLAVNATPEVQTAVQAFTPIMVLIAAIFVLDNSFESNSITESVGFGKFDDARKAALAGLLFSLFFVFIIGGGSGLVIVPFAVSGFAIIALLASIIEEAFFRSTLAPTLARTFSNFPEVFRGTHDYVGGALSCIAFGLFHLLAYNANFGFMFMAIIFGAILLIGNTIFKSTAFGYTSHFTYNFILIYLIGGGLIG